LMELTVPTKSGPPLHVHHREDETYYVLSGDFFLRLANKSILCRKAQQSSHHVKSLIGGQTLPLMMPS
jgi:uncharacterized cupin superfamily protein